MNDNLTFDHYLELNIDYSKVQNIDIVFDSVLMDFIREKKLKFAKKIFNNNNDIEKINSILKSNIQIYSIKINYENLPPTLNRNIFDAELNKIVFSSDVENVYYAKINNIEISNNINMAQDINLMSELKNAFGTEIFKTKNISDILDTQVVSKKQHLKNFKKKNPVKH